MSIFRFDKAGTASFACPDGAALIDKFNRLKSVYTNVKKEQREIVQKRISNFLCHPFLL